ncbi:LuxR C-terminal-related transcriptional regulator [Sphingomonas glaciei]|uniref:Helix-turn-helix transcriptional regulator n=1 Tax=Sphingomonas glaciei TaxID=2938948 RepID=A0ABY5MV72_9SPHN|nr:helix-turn-helix transcriptional regulator [Sphingomonas glaciei]UUR08138.1 helix-turn-helix transcriptional regulator [Sphingomonas glaciei]
MTNVSEKRGDWPLTDRQFQCLEGFWARKTSKQIALELSISHHSVEKHLLACRERLQVSSSAEAARMIFAGDEALAVRPYYEASELHPDAAMSQRSGTHQLPCGSVGVTTEMAPLNRFGAGMTLFLILAIALGSILAVAGLIAAAQGANELGSALLS